MCDESKGELKNAYDKAIEGYKFYVERYKEWMFLYAGFVGAIFVGFNGIGENVSLKFSIALLGMATSIFWVISFEGYYSWNKKWMQLVHYYEDKLYGFTSVGQSLCEDGVNRVYSVVFVDENSKNAGYSSQKVLKCFIWLVICAWVFIVQLEFWKWLPEKWVLPYFIVLCLILILRFIFLIITFLRWLWSKCKKRKKMEKRSCWAYLNNLDFFQSDLDHIWKIENNEEGRKDGTMFK